MTIKRRTHRRSGNAVYEMATLLEWKPETIVQVGVGSISHEVEVFHEEWPDVELIGFEPNPESFRSLVSKYPGQLVNAAAGREGRENVPFYIKTGHDGGSSLLQVGTDKTKLKEVSVSMVRLDSMFPSSGSVYFFRLFHFCRVVPLSGTTRNVLLWMDCEGTELEVLAGAHRFLRHVNMINVEMTGKPSVDGWCTPRSVHDELKRAGFYQTWVHTVRARTGQYDAIYVRGDLFRPEFCCCPEEIDRWILQRFKGTE